MPPPLRTRLSLPLFHHKLQSWSNPLFKQPAFAYGGRFFERLEAFCTLGSTNIFFFTILNPLRVLDHILVSPLFCCWILVFVTHEAPPQGFSISQIRERKKIQSSSSATTNASHSHPNMLLYATRKCNKGNETPSVCLDSPVSCQSVPSKRIVR